MRISRAKPSACGSAAILPMFQRVILAAAASVNAAAAPVVTMPDSAPVIRAMVRLPAACSSAISTDCFAAAAIAATTSGAMRLPPKRVSVPAALILRFTPNAE